jgi:hypothetical protein
LEVKNMKKYVLLGVFALVSLLMIPAALADTTAPITVSGDLTSSVAISIDDPWNPETAPWHLANGDDNYLTGGALHVVALRTDWRVDTTSGWSDNENSKMYKDSGSVPLVNPLMQQFGGDTDVPPYDYTATQYWLTGTQTGTLSDTYATLRYQQEVVDADDPGDYTITLTYTITPT